MVLAVRTIFAGPGTHKMPAFWLIRSLRESRNGC